MKPMQMILVCSCFLVAAADAGAGTIAAITAGQLDDFQGGATMGWTGGYTVKPRHVAANGADGPADGFLEITTSNFHLGASNAVQWMGDYLAAGVQGIEAEFDPTGPDDVALRVLLFGPGGTYASTNLAPLTTDDGWQRVRFSLDAADLTHVTGSFKVPDGTGVLADTLAAVTKLLVRNDYPTPTVPGNHPPHIFATMGIDNVFAIPGTSGDANGDGLVADGDLSLLLAHWDQDAPWRFGNFNGDDTTDDNDLSLLLAGWSAAEGQTPEPLTLAMLVLAGPAMAFKSRRRPAARRA